MGCYTNIVAVLYAQLKARTSDRKKMYRGPGINDVKGSVIVCSDNCTTEGRGGENGGSANTKTKHTEPLTS